MNNIKTGERKMINNSKLVAGEFIPAARWKPSSMLVWDFQGCNSSGVSQALEKQEKLQS